MQSLKERIASYQDLSDYKLLNRIPLVISINGRSFSKYTSTLNKPFCNKFQEGMLSALLKICTEVEGAVFGYQFNDEINLIVRNDLTPESTPWYDNKIQKICSAISSISSIHFNNFSLSENLNTIGDPIFSTQIFTVPTIQEATNFLIFKQQSAFYSSINQACFYELLKKKDKQSIKNMLEGLTLDEKINILQQECNIDYNDYPLIYRRGSACYRSPRIVNDSIKNKWSLNTELPIFTEDSSFLANIIKNGYDVFRNS